MAKDCISHAKLEGVNHFWHENMENTFFTLPKQFFLGRIVERTMYIRIFE